MNLHLTILLLFFTISYGDCRKLVLAQVVSRHGDRGPDATFPNDQYGPRDWPRGYSELTSEGMQQTYKLGQFYRKRYVDTNFLAADYNVNEIYVRSSDVTRSLTSAQCILFGLYPAKGEKMWIDGLPWQPIPVHGFLPSTEDLLLKPTSVDCPAYDNAWKNLTEDQLKQYDTEYAEFFEYVANATGAHLMNMMKISHIYDAVSCERIHNLTNAWAEVEWKNSSRTVFDIIVELKRVFRTSEFNKFPLNKFIGGYLLHDLVDRMQKKAANVATVPQKLVIYSTHDGTVTGLMYAMGVGNDQLTPYAASILLELYQNDQNGFEVDVSFRNDTSAGRPIKLQVPVCGETSCTLDLFASSLGSMMYRTRADFDRDCSLSAATLSAAQTAEEENMVPAYVAWILGGLCLILLFTLILILGCYWRNSIKRNRHVI